MGGGIFLKFNCCFKRRGSGGFWEGRQDRRTREEERVRKVDGEEEEEK